MDDLTPLQDEIIEASARYPELSSVEIAEMVGDEDSGTRSYVIRVQTEYRDTIANRREEYGEPEPKHNGGTGENEEYNVENENDDTSWMERLSRFLSNI